MSDPLSAFVLALFRELDQQDIAHVVARRADLLPCPPAGGDVDVVVARGDLPRSTRLVRELAERHEGLIFAAEDETGSCQLRLALLQADAAPAWLHLHFQDSIGHRGMELLSANRMLEGRRLVDGFWRPAPEVEGVSLLLHDLVTKSCFRERDAKEIVALHQYDSAGFERMLEHSLGPTLTREVAEALAQRNPDLLIPLRERIVWRIRSKQPLAALRWRLQRALRTLGFALGRRGALVVLMGPDGSGKTSLVKEVARILDAGGCKTERIYFGLTTPLLPTKRLLRGLRDQRRARAQPEGQQVPRKPGFRSNLSYFLGSSHALLDQLARYLVHARPRLARARILLCDRYFYDALTSPAPGLLKPALDWTSVYATPRPDLVFVLGDDASAIHARKPELSVWEIERQQACFERLRRSPICAKRVHVTHDPLPNARRIARQVLLAYSKRHFRDPL